MKLVTCGKCSAQFNVATMKPGSSFACGKCRTQVQVPGDSAPATVAMSAEQMRKALEEARAASAPSAAPAAAAAPKAQPKLPPAMMARAQATGPTRAAGAAPAPAAAPAVAEASAPAAPKSRRAAPSGEPKKSPTALYAAIGGGVVVVGVVAVMMSGGDKPKAPSEAPAPVKPAEPPPPPPKPRDPTIHDDFLAMETTAQHDALAARFTAAGSDTTQLRTLYAWVTDAKVASNGEAKSVAKRIVEEVLKADPNADWAREARGDKKIRFILQDCRDQCTRAFQMQDVEEKAVLERLRGIEEREWSDATEFKKYSDIVARIRTRDERMKTDPRYDAAEKKRSWVLENPVFKNVELTWTFADPYVIFQEVKKEDEREISKPVLNAETGRMEGKPKDGTVDPAKRRQNEEWAKKGKLFAERDGILFTELNRLFRELFVERYKLPQLAEKNRTLTGLVMWNRESFDKLLVESGQQVSASIRAFYSPPQQKIYHYIGTESLQERDEWRVEGGFVQKGSDQVTFHEGTHQLQHEYSAIFRGTPLVDNDTKVEPRKAMWFEEGIAEFMGATEVEGSKAEFLQGVTWRHNRILIERIDESRRSRDSTEKWTIKEFLKPNDNIELARDGGRIEPNDPNMPSHFYCRTWAFCHFLWYYDNGKYRPKFYDYFELVMKGTQSSEKFAKLMGRPNASDWGPIEKEYEWYWQQLLRRKVGRNKATNQWETPATDAPKGKVEDDAEFCEIWDENHPKKK